MPQPFLPLFGNGYENSAFKLLVVGQDTKGWGNTDEFVSRELTNPGKVLSNMFQVMDDLFFRGWGLRTHSFFGFAMALLASVHGLRNWNVLKWGGHEDILGSFAWANANAVELWGSLTAHEHRVPKQTWLAARKAGAHLNKLKHMLTTLRPRVVLITYRGLNKEEFFEGLDWKPVVNGSTDKFRHYRIDAHDVDVFHTWHPGHMRNHGGPWSFLNEFRKMLCEKGFAPAYPDFVSSGKESDSVITYLLKHAPRPEGNNQRKYEFVAWVAEELAKRGAFMSVPCLVQLANRAGYRTNYGTEYSGGRGSYRLVRGAYWRYHAHDPARATRIAEAFRKPDFTYAY